MGDILVRTGLGHLGPTSLAEALERCGPNRRVVLTVKTSGDWDVSPLVVGEGKLTRCDNVHVVGERREVTLFSQIPDGPILHIKRVKGFVLKNLTIDGNGRSAPLVVVEGDGLADSRIENVVFQNFKGDAVQFSSARGKKEAPIVLKDCQFLGDGEASKGVVLVGSAGEPSASSHVVASDNKFVGCGVGIAIQGPLALGAVKNNIFALGGTGVQFAPGAAAALLEGFRVESSTFWKLAAGVVLDDAPVGAGKIAVVDSLFIDVGSPPVSAPPAVAAHLKSVTASVEIRGLWANSAVAAKEHAKTVAVGPAPSIATFEFLETDPHKPAFLQPKPRTGDSKAAGQTRVGAGAPVSQ